MALIGLTLGETKDFVSEYDPDKKNPTVFRIGVVDLNVMAQIEDELTTFRFSPQDPTGPADSTLKINQRNIEAVRFGLKGIKNFNNAQGNEIPYKTKKVSRFGKTYEIVSDETLHHIPKKIIDELAAQIVDANVPTETELKNSG